ncbi:MAG: TonB family protein [Aureispira sp.]
MLMYLLESSCCWIILYGCYILLLSNEKTFVYNRAYLLLSLALGLITPLLSFENQVAAVFLAPINLSALATPTLATLEATAANTSYFFILLVLYGLGLLLFGGRFVRGLYKIKTIYNNGQVEQHTHYQLIIMKEHYPPFSFANCLFIPNTLVQDSKDYDCIITHEAAHIQQAHTIDILLVECLQLIFWFNPILILYKMALRDQHEYLADQAVLYKASVHQYGHLLLDQSVSTVLPLVHPFFHSSLKKRIIMMTKNSVNFPLRKYTLSLLACSFAFWMVACQKNIDPKVHAQPDTFPYLASCENSDKEAQKKCSDKTLLEYVYGNVKYPKKAKDAGAEGMVVLDFVVNTDGTIGTMEVFKSAGNKVLDEEGLRVLKQMQKEGSLWKPGQIEGQNVAVSYKLPLRFKLQ